MNVVIVQIIIPVETSILEDDCISYRSGSILLIVEVTCIKLFNKLVV